MVLIAPSCGGQALRDREMRDAKREPGVGGFTIGRLVGAEAAYQFW
ncbi:hypothetical protein [Mycobacterium sp. Root135]|nr:hypothetical protein [Mycobacterium sp. Root135]